MRLIKIMMLTMSILGLASCSVINRSADKPQSDKAGMDIVGKKWQLIEVNGKAVAAEINGRIPYLQLDETRYSANGGCNGIGGELTLEKNGKIKFSKGMSTMMACPDMSIERALSAALLSTDNYTVDGNILNLNKAKMAPLAKFRLLTADQQDISGSWELDYISSARIAFEGLYPHRKPTMNFSAKEGKVNGNSSCNNYNATFKTAGNKISFGPIMSTKMACEGNGEATFFSTLEKVNTYSVSGNTLTFIMGDIAVMRLHRK